MWRFESHADDNGYRWRLTTSDGRPVAASQEFFSSEFNARRSAEHFKAIAPSWLYEVYPEPEGRYRWRAKASNGRTIALSHEAFDSTDDAERAADAVRANARRASGV